MALGRRGTYYGLLAAVFAAAVMMLLAESAGAQAVTISKEDEPDPVRVGNLLLYTIEVNNTTAAPTEVQVEDQLPDDVDYLASDISGGTTDGGADPGDCGENNGEVTCTVTLGPVSNNNNEDTATVQILVEPQETGSIENDADVFLATNLNNPVDTASEDTEVRANNGNNNNNNNDGQFDDFFPPFFDDPDDFDEDFFDEIDEDEDEDDLAQAEEDLAEAEEDLAEAETTTGEGTTGDDGDGGAFAESGDPDDQPPVRGQRGETVDEIDTGGQELPNTPGFPIIAVIIESIICATALVTFWALAVRKARP